MLRLNSWLLAGVLLVGVLLRGYHFFELPFTFDELSAISRLNFNSFNDLIEKGVKIDAHPAGVQTFLYYWCKLFGNAEWIVKLPFALSGIGSIYLIYLVAKNWFGETSGLISAAFVSTLQFTVTYSNIARPYGVGLFFSLLLVLYWSKFLFAKSNNKNGLIYVFSAVACAYTHHFCLLFAFIVGISGLFMLNKDNWKKYLLLNILVIVFYLPHVTIFLYQLNVGGIGGPDGWLGPPESDYLLTFIKYIYNYSILVGMVTLSILIVCFFKHKFLFDGKNKLRVMCIVWFLLPFLIGFYYSRWVNPVLQFSVLIFSFPYIIVLISSFIQETKKWLVVSLVVIICSSNVYSLIFTRQHYKVIAHQASDEYVKYIADLQKHTPKKKVFAILNNTEKPFIDYYIKKYGTEFNYHIFQSKEDTPQKLWSLVKKQSCDYLVVGYLPEAYNSFFKNQFTSFIYHDEGFTYDINCFTKDTSNNNLQETNLYQAKSDFETEPSPPWNFDTNIILKDAANQNSYIALDSLHEWGPGYNIKLDELITQPNSVLLASIKFHDVDTKNLDAILVLQINMGDSLIHWQGSNLGDYSIADNKWQTAFTSCLLIDLLKSNRDIKKYKLSVYLWNKGKSKIEVDDFEIKVKPGNPFIYGLFVPIG